MKGYIEYLSKLVKISESEMMSMYEAAEGNGWTIADECCKLMEDKEARMDKYFCQLLRAECLLKNNWRKVLAIKSHDVCKVRAEIERLLIEEHGEAPLPWTLRQEDDEGKVYYIRVPGNIPHNVPIHCNWPFAFE